MGEKKSNIKITAKMIREALATKHARDLFVPECKDGPTWGGAGHLRLDAWAAKKSYANPLTIGYEIKVSRSDFLGDEKWHHYLEYCNEFYFCCPTGLIQPEELPPEAGLLYLSKTGTRLFTKKKAPRRDVEIPETLYQYILFSRARITSASDFAAKENSEFWRRWLEEKKDLREVGYRCGRRLSAMIREQIEEVRNENVRLKNLHKSYDQIIELLQKLGFDPSSKWSSYNANEKQLRDALAVVPPELIDLLEKTKVALEEFNDIR